MGIAVLCAAALAVVLGGGSLVAAVSTEREASAKRGVTAQRCFGAASRDPRRACHNPRLDGTVVPTPGRALKAPNAPCHVIRRAMPFTCTFGAGEDRARGRIALLGDSHATHWRAALAPVAAKNRWLGYSLTRAACPLSQAEPVLPKRLLPDCRRWRQAAIGWLRDHPEVHTVFVSQHRVTVAVPAGRDRLDTEVAGYVAAWNALPASVRRIVVIRDTPGSPHGTGRCVMDALRRGVQPGPACAYRRSTALSVDPAVVAAQRMRSPRVRVVSMTRFFCDPDRCYPVIGGVLVHKDTSHVTAQYGATLAPYLAQRIKAALR